MSSKRTAKITIMSAAILAVLFGGLYALVMWEGSSTRADAPAIEVVLLDRKDLPSAGAGETPIVCVAPAIGSAVRAFGTVAAELPVRLV